MNKPPVRHLDPIIAWLQTYNDPSTGFLLEYQGDMRGTIHFTEFPAWATHGNPNALAQTNMNAVESKDIFGGVIETVTISYNLFVRRFGSDDWQRQPTMEFVTDFRQWVAEQVRNGEAPTFGNTDTDLEKIIVTFGSKWGDVETAPGLEDYLFQLQLQYRLEYPPPPYE